jgi:hypothetical protein
VKTIVAPRCRGAHTASIALIAIAGFAAVALVAPSPSSAQPSGAVKIQGKRYVNGEETKVKCSNTAGNTLDATTLGTRVFTLVNTPDCGIYTDTPGDSGVLTFTGLEDMIAKNTIVKARYIFSGVETGGLVQGAAEGIMKGKPETARSTFLKDKGTLSYSYVNEFAQQIIFVGKYNAKFQ